jgi:hypothetical protein
MRVAQLSSWAGKDGSSCIDHEHTNDLQHHYASRSPRGGALGLKSSGKGFHVFAAPLYAGLRRFWCALSSCTAPQH